MGSSRLKRQRGAFWGITLQLGLFAGGVLVGQRGGWAAGQDLDSGQVTQVVGEIAEEYAVATFERSDSMQQTRQDRAAADTWDLDPLYPHWDSWESAFASLAAQRDQGWPTVKRPPAEGWTPDAVASMLHGYMEISRQLSKLYVFSHLRNDEDMAQPEPKSANERAQILSSQFAESTSWLEPALLSLPEEQWKALSSAKALEPFRFWLEKLAVQRPHILSAQEERLMAMASLPLSGASRAFSALHNVDFEYGEVLDQNGEKQPLTQGLLGAYLRQPDRVLRANAFHRVYEVLGQHIHTLNELLSTELQAQVFQAKARHYPDVLESSLVPQKIPTSVYRELIRVAHEYLPHLHRYLELRKKVLGVSALEPYDLYVPLVAELELQIPYEQAVEWVVESVAPLGEQYQSVLREGLTTGRWVDPYENKGKRSGAYSSGCYDSHPYILMNYRGTLNDVFTLAHEAGHSMHTWLANRANSYWDARYPLFVAEIASTFNEQLLFDLLLKKLTSPAEQLFLVNQKLEEIRTTLFRQTQFAEFEWWMHQQVEEGKPLTAQSMDEAYAALNSAYYGPALAGSSTIAREWARIPHFFYGYYVYQYATGLSSAIALHDRVVKGDQAARDHYLGFLQAGGSQFPLELVEKAGVELRNGEAVRDALDHFVALLDQMETLLEKQLVAQRLSLEPTSSPNAS